MARGQQEAALKAHQAMSLLQDARGQGEPPVECGYPACLFLFFARMWIDSCVVEKRVEAFCASLVTYSASLSNVGELGDILRFLFSTCIACVKV